VSGLLVAVRLDHVRWPTEMELAEKASASEGSPRALTDPTSRPALRPMPVGPSGSGEGLDEDAVRADRPGLDQAKLQPVDTLREQATPSPEHGREYHQT
jgi:hypothetical protein